MLATLNGRAVEAQAGESILDLARREGLDIPTLCHLKGLSPSGACRMCVVELDGRPGLVTACSQQVQEGMAIHTHSPRAVEARKTIVELLLANHPDDCLYCVRSGDCRLQELAQTHGVRRRRWPAGMRHHRLDVSSPAIGRNPDKCILCGACVRVCEERMGVGAIDFTGRGSSTVVAPAFLGDLNLSTCVGCGQCIAVCPTGALREQSHLDRVVAALEDPEQVVVVQHAPAVSVSLAEEFGLPAGTDLNPQLVAALRRLGFHYVFDTAFAADLTVREEAAELVQRITHGGPLPLFTSCSPAWVRWLEQERPELLPHLSTCKSPQQMMGAVVKSAFARMKGLDPARIFSVSIMPCTAKKAEAARPEHAREGLADVDAVLTVRELARLLRQRGIRLTELKPDHADLPLGMRSTAGKLFGASGGVTEAALRTAHFLITGEDPPPMRVEALHGTEGLRFATVQAGILQLRVAVASGLLQARKLVDEIQQGLHPHLHMVEVMSCPGGCVAGGGQPLSRDGDDAERRRAVRHAALLRVDDEGMLRRPHRNWAVGELYRDELGEPLSQRAHELLHVHRELPREVEA